MAWITFSMMRCLLVGGGFLFVGLITAVPALAQSEGKDDLSDRQRRLQEVQAQKIDADVRTALREATNLADPVQALEKLRALQSKLEDDTTLTAKRKETLIRVIKDRIRVTELAGRTNEKTDQPEPRKQQGSRKSTEKEEIQQSLDTIRTLRKDGKMEDANRSAKELLQKYPDSPSAQTAARTAAAAETLANLRGLRNDREQRLSSVSRDIDRSSTPPSGDVEFPKDFRERTKNRGTKPRLTAKEQAIVRGLNSIISVQFKDSRLEDVIEFLQTYIGQPIVLDPLAMDEVGVKYDTPVTLKLKSITLRTVLKKILRDLGLTYVVKDEMIQVTTPEKAKNMMVVRVYSVADLVRNRFEAAMLIDLIQSTMEPESWKANGGTGTIVYNPLTRSIVIKQNAEFHTSMGSLLP